MSVSREDVKMSIYRLMMTSSILVCCCIRSKINAYESNEYCQWETFNASCGQEEVILMLSARYGRMRFGRCMREDHGSVGCSADVLAHMDRKCSGRRACQMTIPDATLHSSHQCPKEIMPYLEASYICIHVKSGNKHICGLVGGQPLRVESAYLQPTPTFAGDKPTVGSAGCPWLIQMHPGQKINLTLLSFHLVLDGIDAGLASDATARPLTPPVRCSSQRIVIQEKNRTLELALCGEKHRERHIFTSDGNFISLYVHQGFHHQVQEPSVTVGLYLIKYQVVGCPDITDLVNSWVIRRGDTAIVRCNFTGETFFLTCLDTRWKGELSRCTTGSPTKSSQTIHHTIAPPTNRGLLVIIAVGVALGVALGVFLLFAVVLCHRRRKSTRHSPCVECRAGEHLLFDNVADSTEERKAIVYTPVIRSRRAPMAMESCECHHQLSIFSDGPYAHRPPPELTTFGSKNEFSDEPRSSAPAYHPNQYQLRRMSPIFAPPVQTFQKLEELSNLDLDVSTASSAAPSEFLILGGRATDAKFQNAGLDLIKHSLSCDQFTLDDLKTVVKMTPD